MSSGARQLCMYIRSTAGSLPQQLCTGACTAVLAVSCAGVTLSRKTCFAVLSAGQAFLTLLPGFLAHLCSCYLLRA